MLIWTNGDGFTYKDERTGREYSLHELKAYGTDRTSDIIMIWDNETDTPANWVYGATLCEHNPQKLDELVRECLEANAPRAPQDVVQYNLTTTGVHAFIEDALRDTHDALDRGHGEEQDIYITIGKRQIRIWTGADNFSAIELALQDCLETELENGGI